MGTSMGQAEAKGHSGGMLGHGGHHRMGGHGSHVGSHTSSPHVQRHMAGHTMANSHGGTFPMGSGDSDHDGM